ncbi:hypothetical protein KIN20_021126 [Parelaphostrongylus tenuis]|uniref:Midasin n=1 Tax=Parelaphostrongylus tenuis TaxID=148309 RepID=A0AAD5MNG5_PARTN|nr:hypothetical protein KIN20_021126 [Parelaphostrongylus tenuis]
MKAGGRVRKARQLVEDICAAATKLCDTSGIIELSEQTKSCDEAIRTQINYQGEDSEKEKQQGCARNSRQRSVAMVIKDLQGVGLNARKAAVLNRELLTRSSLTEVVRHRAEELSIRKCSGGRNACIRKSLVPNNQLGVATRRHLEGLVDYGMSWIMKCHKNLVEWEEFCSLFNRKTRALERIESNSKVGWFVNHEQMSLSWKFLHLRTTELVRLTDMMRKRISNVSDTDINEQELEEYEHPLSRLHAQSPQLEGLQKNVTEAYSLSQRIHEIASTLFKESEKDVFEKASVLPHLEHLSSDCTMLETFLNELEYWFEFQCAQARQIQRDIVTKLEVEVIETKTISVSLDDVLLFVQNLYKSLVENKPLDELRVMDRLDYILNVITTVGISKVASWACQVVSDARIGLLMEDINEVTSLMRIISSLLSSVNQMISSVLQAFIGLYYVIVSMSMQLFEKGYIDPIPKAEKQKGDSNDTSESGEGGGFGEGEVNSDARDVTDEMEESGQIEGLQDDECEPSSGDAGQNDKPIEMDEDFAEDICDIDRNEAAEDDKSDEGSEEEPEFEDQLGEVDEADDQQLDPKLWDDEEKDKDPKGCDDGSTAADNKIDELAANDRDTVEADEKPSADEDEKNCEEEGEDGEDVDGQEHDDVQESETAKDDPSTEFPDEDSQGAQEEAMSVDNAEHDSTDDEMENDGEINAEEMGDGEEVTEESNIMKNELQGTETEQKMDDSKTMQQGSGGEQKNQEKNDKTGVSMKTLVKIFKMIKKKEMAKMTTVEIKENVQNLGITMKERTAKKKKIRVKRR